MKEIIHLLPDDERELIQKVLQRPTPFYVKLTDPIQYKSWEHKDAIPEASLMEAHGACLIYYEKENHCFIYKIKLKDVLDKCEIDTDRDMYSNEDIDKMVSVYKEYYKMEYAPIYKLAVAELDKEIESTECRLLKLKDIKNLVKTK